MSNKKYSKKALEESRDLYMQYHSFPEIEARTKVAVSALKHHAKKWKGERELLKAQLFAQMSATKKVHFTKMTTATITIMERALQDLATRDTPPTMQEATKAAEIMGTLDRINRLDEGKATDIISDQEQPLTIEVLKEKIALDPFSSTKEAEYKELEDESIEKPN